MILVHTFQNGIEIQFCAKENAVNFRYENPAAEKDGQRLIDFKNTFAQNNTDWACFDNSPVEMVEKFNDAQQADFLKKTNNNGVLWISFKKAVMASQIMESV